MRQDAELLERWNGGDEAAGKALVERYFGKMYVFFRNKAPLSCEELVQSTFMACLEKRHELRAASSFRSFLYGIARIELFRSYRPNALEQRQVELNERSVHDFDPSPSRIIVERQEHRLVLEALRRIPVDLQILIELHYWEGLNTAEMAEVLEMPRGTVKGRLRRARDLIGEAIDELASHRAVSKSTIDGFEDWVSEVRALMDKPG